MSKVFSVRIRAIREVMASLDPRKKDGIMAATVSEFHNRVLGCWMGKNIGGTLGMPVEWKRQINDFTFYTQKLGGEPLPNDDLDIQLLWLVALEQRGIRLNAQDLAEYWCNYITPHWVEYGTGKMNMRAGLMPPLCGDYGNDYRDSCGSFIRTEIWACIAPANPMVAVRYAYNDSILDHGHGEGTWAALFVAAVESAAFVVGDLRKLVEIGLSYIPEDCGVAKAVRHTIACFDKKMTWQDTRDEILRHFRGSTFFGWRNCISDRDFEKGFYDGKPGWDAPSNIAILVLGLLYGGDDFEKTICVAVNCGEDTDCTAATAGSIWGIMHGYDKIPQKWIDPIGRTIKTITINMGDIGGSIAKDVDNLTDRTKTVASTVVTANNIPVNIWETGKPMLTRAVSAESMFCCDRNSIAMGFPNGPITRQGPLFVALDYDCDACIRPGVDKKLRVTIANGNNIQLNLNLHWYLPEGCSVLPGTDGTLQLMANYFKPNSKTLEFTFRFEKIEAPMIRAALEITAAGLPVVGLVPVVFQNGTYA